MILAGEVQLSSSNSSELILTLWLNDDDDALIEIKVVGKRIVVSVNAGCGISHPLHVVASKQAGRQ